MALTASERQRIKRMLDDLDSHRRNKIRAKREALMNWLMGIAEIIIKEITKEVLRHLVDTFLNN
ncbi:MAG: hypothetical protein QM487_15455 [Candidatus Marithrix sp.]